MLSDSLPEEDFGTPDLLGSEQYELCTFSNLDDFFQRIYRCAGYASLQLKSLRALSSLKLFSFLQV